MEYLRNNELTENLIEYVSLCIAMTEGTAPALEVKVAFIPKCGVSGMKCFTRVCKQ